MKEKSLKKIVSFLLVCLLILATPLAALAEDGVQDVDTQVAVTITLLGDDAHGSGGQEHTYLAGNLQTWIPTQTYYIYEGSTVKDLLLRAFADYNLSFEGDGESPENLTYISAVIRDGVRLAAFTNGRNSGWMYVINGQYSNNTIAEQTLSAGDSLVFYYTDNYNKEKPHQHDWVQEWSSDSMYHWHECDGSGADCDAAQNSQKDGFGAHTGKWVITRKATCTEKGTETFTCTVCGYTKTRSISAKGHNTVVLKGKSPTCLATGLTQGKKCSVCGKILVKQQVIAKLPAKGSLSLKNFPLKVKQSYTLKVNGMATGDRVASWKSSNTRIATVTSAGVVTGKAKGNATITATLASGLKLSTTVKVQTGTVKTTGITVNTKNVTVKTQQGFQLIATRNPVTSQQGMQYSTSNKKIATVTSNGYIKGVKAGTATITVKSGSKSVKIKVKVEGVKTTGLTANKTEITLKKKQSFAWKVKTVPANSSEKITYTTSNKNVATVSTSGKITARKAGTATITAKSGNKKISLKVTVK